MDLLLLSSSRTPAGYLTDYMEVIRDFTGGMQSGGVRKAVFIPFAAVRMPAEEFARRVREATGFSLAIAHAVSDLENADLIIVGGGNTFQLLKQCRERRLLPVIRERMKNGCRYLGWSAGANLACPTIRTTNDMPIVDPGGLDALGLIPFQINPHYLSVALPGHHGETRDERLEEFTLANPGLRVLGLPEGNWVRVSGESAQLGGPHPSIWFEDGRRFSATAGQFSVLGGRGKQR